MLGSRRNDQCVCSQLQPSRCSRSTSSPDWRLAHHGRLDQHIPKGVHLLRDGLLGIRGDDQPAVAEGSSRPSSEQERPTKRGKGQDKGQGPRARTRARGGGRGKDRQGAGVENARLGKAHIGGHRTPARGSGVGHEHLWHAFPSAWRHAARVVRRFRGHARISRAGVVFVGEQRRPNTHRLEHAVLDGLRRRRVPLTMSMECSSATIQDVVAAT